MSILRPTIGAADFKIIKPQQDQIERSLRGYMALPAQWQSTEGSSPTVRATFGLEP
jgi:hypothetical protein